MGRQAIEWPEILPWPRQGVSLVDSHLHLGPPDASEVVAFAERCGGVLFPCGVDERSSIAILKAAEAHRGVLRPFVGVHPSEAAKSEGLGWLGDALDQAAGTGEIGLDPSYSPTGEGTPQLRVFVAQVEASERRGLPVQVHSRGAERQVMEILQTYRPKSVLMHWLEKEELLPAVIDRGWFVSFSPAVLYSKKLQRIAKRCDPALALAESDSPVAYAPLGSVHGPSLIPSVAFRLGELWGMPFADALKATAENAMSFLGSSSKG